MICDCQKGALVYFEDQQDASRVAYNMQRQMETTVPGLDNDGDMSFRICADVEVGHCPACNKELPVAETITPPGDQSY